MQIVFLARNFYPHLGGVEKHVLKISEILVRKHRVTVITEKTNKNDPDEEVYKNIHIKRISITSSEKNKKYEIWKYLLRNFDILRSADVIHVHDVFFWYLPFRFIFLRKKVFVTFHGYEGDSLPSRKAILSHKIAENLSRGNICVGDYLRKWYGTKPDYVTYGAVDKARNQAERPLRNIIKALYVGRLEPEAGILDYLVILRSLKSEGLNLKLTVLGDGGQRKVAERFVKRHKLDVVFRGFVKDTESFLPGADLVFTSRYLGTLEAMNYRRAVFCVYNNEIKKDCFVMSPFREYIYQSYNPSDLALELLQSLKDKKGRQKRIEMGYNYAHRQTWEKLTKIYLRLWQK